MQVLQVKKSLQNFNINEVLMSWSISDELYGRDLCFVSMVTPQIQSIRTFDHKLKG